MQYRAEFIIDNSIDNQSDEGESAGARGSEGAKKSPRERSKRGLYKKKSGDYLLSHTPAHAVPSAYRSLTTLF
ncbi:MAG: hypothetical protein LWX56_12465, partial [Ignavibacteria bacterium]|nr:hypothetical protein [Ignavibacteria bacterium]